MKHYRTDKTRELWSKAAGAALITLATGNRLRQIVKDSDEPSKSDVKLTKGAKIFNRSSDCINRFHKNLSYYCAEERLWHCKENLMYVVWDLNEYESLRVPHRKLDHVIFSLKSYLPVRWIAANPKVFRGLEIPSADSFQRLDVDRSSALNDVFATVMSADSFVESSRERSCERS